MEFRQPQKLALTPSTPSAIYQKYATQKAFQSHTHQLGRNAHTITNPHTTMAKPETRKYPHPTDKLFNAALMVVRELGYKIDTIDKVNGLLNFKTGMSWKSFAGQEMSVLVLDNSELLALSLTVGVKLPRIAFKTLENKVFKRWLQR